MANLDLNGLFSPFQHLSKDGKTTFWWSRWREFLRHEMEHGFMTEEEAFLKALEFEIKKKDREFTTPSE